MLLPTRGTRAVILAAAPVPAASPTATASVLRDVEALSVQLLVPISRHFIACPIIIFPVRACRREMVCLVADVASTLVFYVNHCHFPFTAGATPPGR